MDLIERLKRLKRAIDAKISYKKLFLIVVVVFGFLLYVAPYLLRLLFSRHSSYLDDDSYVMYKRLLPYMTSAEQFDSHIIRHDEVESPVFSLLSKEKFFPFVGNGYVGLSLDPDSPIYLHFGRVLQLSVNYRPVALVSVDGASLTEATVLEYTKGLAHRIQCYRQGALYVDVHYTYYAHRKLPGQLIQEIKITNPSDVDAIMDVFSPGMGSWESASLEKLKLPHGTDEHEYIIVSGQIPTTKDHVMAVAIATSSLPPSVEVKSKMSNTLTIITVVKYSSSILKLEYNDNQREIVKKEVMQELRSAVSMSPRQIKTDHVVVWEDLWKTGFSISMSKAEGALNGDRINATIYAILSQVRAPLYESGLSIHKRNELASLLSYPDRCYGGHHTMQAADLWSSLTSMHEVNKVCHQWLLTLDKQGCSNLLRAGADGAMQAVVLSLGSLSYSNHHLEFNTHPSDLHRDFTFRRLNYGNATHVNITVMVGDDNKAVLSVALDRSDKDYYACDAGCLDPPVLLGQVAKPFPVKLTDPITAILYITADKTHMEELKHTIHVREVVEAPAHEHHVIAMHRHGHHWGGLPTLFWVSIAVLVVVFHLFLFKLIYNEYCGGQEFKFRTRKFSDL